MGEIERLSATVDEFCRFINGLPQAAVVEQIWGPKEVLAHLVFYHESYLVQVEARLTGELFQPPRGRFSDLNAQAVAASRGVPIGELIDRFQSANEALCDLYEEHDPQTIIMEIKQGAKLRTLAELVPEVEAHVRNHQRKLMGRIRGLKLI